MFMRKSKLILIIMLVMLFFVGVHNFDTGQNMRVMNAQMSEFNITLQENSLIIRDVSAESTYMLGLAVCIISFITMCLLHFSP